MSNFTERLTIIGMVELKQRNRTLLKTFKNNLSPTALFQIDEDFLLVGTQNGKIEMWNIEAGKIVKYIDAHSESKAGIS